MRDTILEYKKYLNLRNYSKNTIDLYIRDLKDYREFLKMYDNVIPEEATKTDVLQYLYYLNEKGNGSNTRHHKYFTLKSYYKWFCKKYAKVNPTYSIEPIKIAERLPKYLTLEQAKKIQNVFDNQKYNTIIQLFLSTGLRVSEVCNIKLSDIDMSNSSLNVKCKGNKVRTTYLSSSLLKRLKIYCDEFQPHIYLFENGRGKPYTRRGIYEIVQRAYKKIGVEGLGVHSLRHTVATMIYQSTRDLLIVKEVLGHESVESTIIYAHVSNEIVREAVNKNPLNR